MIKNAAKFNTLGPSPLIEKTPDSPPLLKLMNSFLASLDGDSAAQSQLRAQLVLSYAENTPGAVQALSRLELAVYIAITNNCGEVLI